MSHLKEYEEQVSEAMMAQKTLDNKVAQLKDDLRIQQLVLKTLAQHKDSREAGTQTYELHFQFSKYEHWAYEALGAQDRLEKRVDELLWEVDSYKCALRIRDLDMEEVEAELQLNNEKKERVSKERKAVEKAVVEAKELITQLQLTPKRKDPRENNKKLSLYFAQKAFN
ncbi:hypothetical protein L596_013352 [Steinernema carpocapsae]|uniref:Uncharacterized protein n=1 Tax=Steinernema carpocapsae TaxID=34508 RepID=A0A4V6A526_STECR|nr:hypothetical protein L596_013352 [Steinernema carpocapsae]